MSLNSSDQSSITVSFVLNRFLYGTLKYVLKLDWAVWVQRKKVINIIIWKLSKQLGPLLHLGVYSLFSTQVISKSPWRWTGAAHLEVSLVSFLCWLQDCKILSPSFKWQMPFHIQVTRPDSGFYNSWRWHYQKEVKKSKWEIPVLSVVI